MPPDLPANPDRSTQLEQDADEQLSDDLASLPTDRSPIKSESSERQSGKASDHPTPQKRRRVTRACDECRRKKIKCDGKQPCTHCTVYSYDCTYDQPSQRRRNPAPQYVEALEQRLARTEAILRTFLPDLDIDDPSLDARIQENQETPSSDQLGPQGSQSGRSTSFDTGLESMVEATGQLEIDKEGNWDYHGHSSGLSFIRRVREQLGDLNGPEQAEDDPISRRPPRKTFSKSVPVPRGAFEPGALEPDSPRQLLGEGMQESPFDNQDVGTDELPSKQLALTLCSAALDDACAILNIVHHPTFYTSFHRIYDRHPDEFNDQDHKFLPLLYVVLGLGCLFDKDEDSELERKGYKSATGVGYKYFWAARQMMDITDCRDLTSLQTIVFMIMFLQCSAKLSTCYAYVGVALRSALRMGLHRSFMDFDPIEAECRKRVFWTIRKMDIYVGAMLGLPQTLHDDDIDQEFPTEVPDDCITAQGISPIPPGSDPPPMAAANANFRLCQLVSKIVRLIYPIKGSHNDGTTTSGAYSVPYSSVKEIETDLQQWQESLPPQLVPGYEHPSPEVIRMQQLLRMAYAHAQLMLYRPFLHYVSTKRQLKSVNQRSYACAAACVSVSRNIIHITAELKRRGLLRGSYWFSMYSTFFGILSLIFFALENPESAHQQDVFEDAKEGKETLARLAKRSMAADRCTVTLNVLFEQIGPTLEEGAQASSSKKRDARQTGPETSVQAVKSVTSRPRNSRGKNPKTKKDNPVALPLPARPQPSRSISMPHTQSHASSVPFRQDRGGESSATSSSSGAYGAARSVQAAQMYSQQRQQMHQEHQQRQQMPYYQSQFDQYPSNLTNLSAVMFPSDNPFVYPNQPMTTLEQNYAFNAQPSRNEQVQAMPTTSGQGEYHPQGTGGGPVSQDEHMDVHLLGPLPPYLSQGHTNASYNTNQWQQNLPPTTGAEMWNQQARSHGLPGMNLDDIFAGEEWHNEEQE